MKPGRSQLPSANGLSVGGNLPELFEPSKNSQDRTSSLASWEGELELPFNLSAMPWDAGVEGGCFNSPSEVVNAANRSPTDKECQATTNSRHQGIHSESWLALGTSCDPSESDGKRLTY